MQASRANNLLRSTIAAKLLCVKLIVTLSPGTSSNINAEYVWVDGVATAERAPASLLVAFVFIICPGNSNAQRASSRLSLLV
jgi:hypothetical protein